MLMPSLYKIFDSLFNNFIVTLATEFMDIFFIYGLEKVLETLKNEGMRKKE